MSCNCCCCGSHHRGEDKEEAFEMRRTRRFLTKEEKVEKLKDYAEELRKELAGVEEHIKELET